MMLASDANAPVGESQRKHFFIVATARSGTTLLERLLNRHSRVFIPPETAFFTLLKRRGMLTREFSPDSMRQFLDYYLSRRPARFLGLHAMPGVEERLLHGARSCRDVFLNLLGLVAGEDQSTVLGEKTPHHLRCADYLVSTFPDTRIIGMIRDGRAVVRSRLEHPCWEHNLLGASRQWAADARRLDEILGGMHTDRVLLVFFEKLLAEPEQELRRICQFLGEEFEPSMLDQTPSVPGRFEEYYRQPWMEKSVSRIDVTRAHSWQETYTPAELALVEHELGEDLLRFRYPLMGPPSASWRRLWLREWVRHHAYMSGKWVRTRVIEHRFLQRDNATQLRGWTSRMSKANQSTARNQAELESSECRE
jgi:hypothetical protein